MNACVGEEDADEEALAAQATGHGLEVTQHRWPNLAKDGWSVPKTAAPAKAFHWQRLLAPSQQPG